MTALLMGLVAVVQTPAPFAIGVQAWSFNQFSALDAIDRAIRCGTHQIEFFPGQRVGGEYESDQVGPDMSDAAKTALLARLKDRGVRVAAYGVTGIDKNPEGARKLFRWAKSLGVETINTESTESLDTIEMMVKEFDMKVGFHNHPKNNNPDYRMWDPNYIYGLVKNRDKRIGSCADTGHWVRSGIKPVDAIRILQGRIVSSHLKDLNVFSAEGHDVPYGTGVSDIAGILNEYRKIKFTGPISVEYEYNWNDSIPEISQSIGFVRGFDAHR